MKKNIILTSLSISISVGTLLCSCNQNATMGIEFESSESGVKVDKEVNCGLFSRDKRCNANYLLGQCDGDRIVLEERIGALEEKLLDAQAELVRCKSPVLYDASRNPTNTIMPKDVYIGAGGMAVGVLGLWTYQKLTGAKKKAQEKILTKETAVESSSSDNREPTLIAGEGGDNEDRSVRGGVEGRLDTLEDSVKKSEKDLRELKQDAKEALRVSSETMTSFMDITLAVTSIARSVVTSEDTNAELMSTLSELESRRNKNLQITKDN